MSVRLILHEDPISGNCYKIRLTAALLGLPLERRAYDIRQGETRTAEFLREVNANGRIPVLQISDDEYRRMLPESNAACWYLADQGSPGRALIPADRFERADMLRWMFFEQYNHEPNIATLRFWLAFVGESALTPEQRALIPGKRRGGEAALALMDEHLANRPWFVGQAPSLADIALFAYTHVAGDGGFDLAGFEHVAGWIGMVRELPGFLPMD